MKSLRQILVITLGLLCIISCEKDVAHPVETFNTTNEKLITQFFDVGFLETNNPNVHSTTGINTRSTDPLITEIMADMQLAEYETAYINELIDHLGFPAWNHAEVVPHDGNEEIAVLPFAHVEGSSISGVLLATRKENGMKYRLIDKGAMLQIGRQYSDHSFYLASLLYLAHMDKVVFDEVECQLAAMLNAASSNLVEEGIITVRSCYTVTVFWERCVRWLIHVASEDDPEGGYFYEDETCTTYPVTITVCESDAQDILGTATPGDDYFVPPPHTDPPENTNPYGSNPEPNNTLIKKLLNLTEEEADCFNTLPLDVRESLLIDVMSNSITDPCNPLLSSADIISDAIKAACRYGEMTEGGIFEALGEVDYIIEDLSLVNCPILNCIYNHISSQQSNNFICNYLTPSFDDSNFAVTISVGDVNGGGESYYNSENQMAHLVLSNGNCFNDEPNELRISAQILHEFVHVELFRQMVGSGLDPNNFEDYYTFWSTWADWIYDMAVQQGVEEIHHHVMLEYQKIIRPLAESLFELFNGESYGLTIDHFMMSAANGLFYAMEIHASGDPNFNSLYGSFIDQYASLASELLTLNLSLGCE